MLMMVVGDDVANKQSKISNLKCKILNIESQILNLLEYLILKGSLESSCFCCQWKAGC